MSVILMIMPALLLGMQFSPDVRADEILAGFVTEVSESSVTFTYSYSIIDRGTEVTGNGTVEMQGEAYIMSGDGLEIYCDGKTRWTVDRQSLEVVIESYDPETPDYTVNPAVLVGHFDRMFHVKSVSCTDTGFDYVLVPESAGTGISEMKISLASDGKRLLSAGFRTENGTVADFTIPSFSFSPVSDSGRFSFDTSSLDGSYVVTDLR